MSVARKVQIDGGVTVDPGEEIVARDSIVEAAAGKLVDERTVSVTGRNDAVSAREAIWTNGGLFTFNSAAGDLVFVSSSANDDIAGTGARTLYIEYLDSNGDEVVTNVAMAGLSNVTIANVWRLNVARVSSAGTYHGTNDGVISITLAGTTRGQILAGEGKLQSAVFSVPNNRNAHLLGYKVSTQDGALGSANVVLYIHGGTPFDSPNMASAEGFRLWVNNGQFDTLTRNLPEWPEKSDIWFETEWLSGGTAQVSVAMNLYVRPI